MRKWTITAHEPQEVAILLFERFSNHCLANLVEPLRAANGLLREDFYRWRFVTLDGRGVHSSSGLPVLPNMPLEEHPGGDYLFVVSSYDFREFSSKQTAIALRSAARRFSHVAGMDTGAWLMANSGLLDGRSATIHWEELTAFSECFSQIDALPERYVIDGNRITSGGAMAAFDLSLELIRLTHGEALRLDVSALFMHRGSEAPQVSNLTHGASPLVTRCISIMMTALEAPIPIQDLAGKVGVSQRSLARAFQKELGASPKAVYKRLRLASAWRYARESTYSISEIAVRCGYEDAAAMTRAFVEQYGQPPSAFRRKA